MRTCGGARRTCWGEPGVSRTTKTPGVNRALWVARPEERRAWRGAQTGPFAALPPYYDDEKLTGPIVLHGDDGPVVFLELVQK